MAAEQARGNAHTDQTRCSNATCSVRSGELLPLVSTAWAACTAAADAQAPRHRVVDQLAEDPLCNFVPIKSRQKQALIEKDYQQQLVGLFDTSAVR